jgi:hypothetical protein
MPVLIRSGQGTAPGQVLPDVGFCVATWYAPDGSVWPLTAPDSGVITQAEGVSGLGAAAITITTDDRARGGVRVRHVQANERVITWPLYVYGEDHMDFVELWRRVATAFTSTSRHGPGTLEIARPDGSARRVQAYYQAGFDVSGKQGYGIISDYCVLTLLCEDPYWTSATPVRIHREYGVPVDFQDPYPTLSSGQVLGATTVTNDGDVEVWPDWVITGPASGITATNSTRGEAFTLDPDADAIGHGSLAEGEQVTISTDPPQVRGPDGSNWTGALSWPGAVLWPLDPGQSDVDFDLAGAGPGSAVDLTYYPRYETA